MRAGEGLEVSLTIEAQDLSEGHRPLTLRWEAADNRLLDQIEDDFYFLPPKPAQRPLEGVKVACMETSSDQPYTTFLRKAGAQVITLPEEDLLRRSQATDEVWLLDGYGMRSIEAWEGKLAQPGSRALVFNAAAIPEGRIGPVNVLKLTGELPYAHHFEPIINRRAKLGDIYRPKEGVWETDRHPIRKHLEDRYWRPSTDEAIAEGVMLHPGCAINHVFRQYNSVGAAMASDTAGCEKEKELTSDFNRAHFRSIITGSRREYSVLGEVIFDSGGLTLVSCLNLDSRLDSEEDGGTLLANAIRYLSGSSKLAAVEERVIVHHGLAALPDDASLQRFGLRLQRPTSGTNHISLDQRSLFSSTKCKGLLEARLTPPVLIVPDAEAEVRGGWLAMEIKAGHEVFGPFFPWEFQTDHPRVLGYLGLEVVVDGQTHVFLLETLKKDKQPPHQRFLQRNLNEAYRVVEYVNPDETLPHA